MSKVNGYQLSRDWFNFAFEKKEAKVQHTALYLWLVELNNRLGWKEEFQLPTLDTMDGLSIGNKLTYLNTLKDLRKWKFIEIVQESKNQYQATVIKLCRNEIVTAQVTALDMALQQHSTQHSNSIDTSIGTGSVPIDKQVNNETSKQEKDIDIKFEITPQGIIEETPKPLPPKKEKPKFTPPTLDEVKNYFIEKGYKVEAAVKAFNYYAAGNWKDSNGRPVKNWQQKMNGVWFKDENKVAAHSPQGTINPADLIPNPEQYLGYNKFYHEHKDYRNVFENETWNYSRMV